MNLRTGGGFLEARLGYRQASKETTRETVMQKRTILAIVAFATLELRVLASEQPTWPSTVTVSVTLEDRSITTSACASTHRRRHAAVDCDSTDDENLSVRTPFPVRQTRLRADRMAPRGE
jgi:hypothetical protein